MTSIQHKKSPFIGEKVLLRAIELTDVPLMMEYWNTYETRIGLGVFIPDSSQRREEWVKEITEKRKKGESFIFAIINKKTGLLVDIDENALRNITKAVDYMKPKRAKKMRKNCEKRAKLFSEKNFIKRMKREIRI